MPSANDATIAAYFRFGVEAGLFDEEPIKAWAYSVIELRDAPPAEIIELATSHGRQQLFDNLNAIKGEPDIQLAGRWLLGALKTELAKDPSQLQAITRKALQVARSTKQPEDVYYRFDGIDDELFLALNNTYGTVEQCKIELEEALAEYNEKT